MRKGGALKKEDKFKKNELLKITWIDAFTLPKGWLSSEEVEERMETPESIETVGFFYCQTKFQFLIGELQTKSEIQFSWLPHSFNSS